MARWSGLRGEEGGRQERAPLLSSACGKGKGREQEQDRTQRTSDGLADRRGKVRVGWIKMFTALAGKRGPPNYLLLPFFCLANASQFPLKNGRG